MRLDDFSKLLQMQDFDDETIKKAATLETVGAVHMIDNYLCVATPEMDIYSTRIHDDSQSGIKGAVTSLCVALAQKIHDVQPKERPKYPVTKPIDPSFYK